MRRADEQRDVRRLFDGPPRRVAVFRALKLGDLLCAVPAIRALRAALPDSEVVLVGLPWAREFVARFDAYLDGFRPIPGWPGLPESAAQLDRVPGFLAEMQAEAFDLAVQFHGSGGLTNPLVALFGAKRTAGFYVPDNYRPDPDLFLPWPERGPEVRRLLALIEFLGIPPRGADLEFPLRDGDFEALRAAGGEELRPGEYVCVHPGASAPDKCWPAGHFAAVAEELARRGLRVVLTGTAAEADLTRTVAGAMKAPALDFAGRTDLGAAAALLAGARLLVSNDTGVSHLAAALGTPSVVVFGASDPERWAPADSSRHRVLRRCDGVGPREVLEQADDLLRQRREPTVRPGYPDTTNPKGHTPRCNGCAS